MKIDKFKYSVLKCFFFNGSLNFGQVSDDHIFQAIDFEKVKRCNT